MTEADQIKERLANKPELEKLIYEVFYGGPLAFAKKNLAIAIERYVLGLPRLTRDEEQREYLDTLTAEERAAWWRRENERRELEKK